MGDRTNCSMTVYSCPPEQVRAVLDIMEEYLRDNDWGDYQGHDDVLHLGSNMGAWEASCGSSDEIASAMQDRAPGAAYFVHEDPYADWLGSVNIYTPELGHFGAECDANGTPQYTADMVRKIIQLDTLEEREKALGDPWLTDDLTSLKTLLPPKEQRFVPALPECPSDESHFWGEDKDCRVCVTVIDRNDSSGRVIIDDIPSTGLVKVIARPTSITFQCATCTRVEKDHLGTRKIEVTTAGYWPTDAQAHTAHGGLAKGDGSHCAESWEIKEVTV